MAKTIAFPVGRGGMNLPGDMAVVWELLNGVPSSNGVGYTPLPAANDLTALIAAIQRFQQEEKIAPANGLITKDSPTLFKLASYYDRFSGGSAQGAFIASVRDRVCAAARMYCGKTSDQIAANGVNLNDYRAKVAEMQRANRYLPKNQRTTMAVDNSNWKDLRFGGDFLKRLFDDILLHPIRWTDDKKYWFDSKYVGRHEVTNLDGVYKRNMRVPLRNAEAGGIHWCGMFATWVWRQCGVDIKWRSDLFPSRPMIGGNFLDTRDDKHNMKHGDIACIPEQSHHFIIMTDPESTMDSTLLHSVDGNDGYQEIREHDGRMYPKVHTMKKVCAYYSLEEAFSKLVDQKGIKRPKF